MIRKKIFISLIVLIAIFILPNVVKAATSDIVLEKIEVVSPTSGTYTTGQVITINAVYSGNVVAEDETYVPTLRLKFGTSELYGSVSVREGTIKDNIIEYKHTIQDDESGELSLAGYSEYGLKDENGDTIESTTPSGLSGNKISANPIKWSDTSNLSFSVDEEYDLNIKGFTELARHSYYVYITNDSKEPSITLDENGNIKNYKIFSSKYDLEKLLEKSGDIYYWLCEEQRNYATGVIERKFIVPGRKIERPLQKSLGSRMKCYFFSEHTSIHLYEPHDSDVNRNVKLKIGKVKDNSILLAIKNNEKNALSKLLNYAKSADSIYTGNSLVGRSDTITNKMELIDKEYYYVYMVLDDENGKYYPVEEVSLYQALVGETVGKNLFDYLDGQFTWNIDEKDYFSDFSNAKAIIESLVIDTESDKQEVIFAINNIISNLEKKHQFYFYISNSTQDIPKYDSELWTKADKFTINESTGQCYISTGNIMNLSYIDNINMSENVYISIYEVVADEAITSEKISGQYKLVLNAKKVTLEMAEDENVENEKVEVKDEGKDDTTVTPDSKLPQTGVNMSTMISLVTIIVLIALVTMKKYRNMKDIK